MRAALGGNEPLAQLLDLCLAPDPQARFHSISDFQNDLVSLIRDCSPSVEAGVDDDNSDTLSLIE